MYIYLQKIQPIKDVGKVLGGMPIIERHLNRNWIGRRGFVVFSCDLFFAFFPFPFFFLVSLGFSWCDLFCDCWQQLSSAAKLRSFIIDLFSCVFFSQSRIFIQPIKALGKVLGGVLIIERLFNRNWIVHEGFVVLYCEFFWESSIFWVDVICFVIVDSRTCTTLNLRSFF